MINSGDVWSSRQKKHSLIIEIKVNRSGNDETFPPATQCAGIARKQEATR